MAYPADIFRCPQCGCSMEAPLNLAAEPPLVLIECPIHGLFHFGPDTSLTPGAPASVGWRFGNGEGRVAESC
jgi:hypothetical protein